MINEIKDIEMEKKRILIVDDDTRNIFALSATLKRRGYDCLSCSSALEALEIIKQGQEVDIILLDMMMPDMDGMTVFSELKKRFGDKTPAVIFMTAKVQVQEVQNYKNVGAAGVIMKPFDPMKLGKTVKEFLP